MPTKPKATSKTNSRLELAKAINGITTKQDAFIKAVDSFKDLTKESLEELNLKIESKQTEFDQLEQKYNTILKQKKIETDQELQEYKYEAAKTILKERSETPIAAEELKSMKTELESLKKDRAEELAALVEQEKKRGADALKAALNNNNLTHKAEIAEMKATVDQQRKEIESLHKTVENMKEEIAAQRQLTKEVAQASRQAPITQQIGKQ